MKTTPRKKTTVKKEKKTSRKQKSPRKVKTEDQVTAATLTVPVPEIDPNNNVAGDKSDAESVSSVDC